MFRKAEKRQAKLRLALCGPSGSGKTYSALLIAKGLAPNGMIAVLDTERGSAEIYSDIMSYDVAPLAPPFLPGRYIDVIKAADAANYDVLIIDSLSHAWMGEGGILDMHDKATAAQRSGNSFTAWREVTPKHNALVDAMIGANLHLIVTMRTKTAYELTDDGSGKKKPIKIGLSPVQRDGLEYEFTTVMDLSVENHVATATKDRTRLFDGEHFIPTVEIGTKLIEWLNTGKNPVAESEHLLKTFQAQVATINDVSNLGNWWRMHAAQIGLLLPVDRETLTQACAARKRILQDDGERPEPIPETAAPAATSRGNGKYHAAATASDAI